jgi:feruloyl esterase
MFDAASTDLKPFAAHGGKLILWHGLNDVMIPARATMAYYDGVEKFMGRAATSQFLRAFYPPGVGHCGGGDGYTEIDILSALMNWVESKHAPTQIVAGKTATPVTTVGASGVIEPGVSKPYAAPQRELVAKRPLYPYPYIARYTGKGDPDNAANYTRAMSDAKPWPPYDYQAVTLIGPDTQRNYEVRSGRIQQVVGR